MNNQRLAPLMLVVCIAAACASAMFFGNHLRTWSDASEYSAYAQNLADNGLYSKDGIHFNIDREPGYPAFLAIIYFIFGNQNFAAVSIIQAALFGLAGFMFFMLLRKYDTLMAILASISIAAFPSYGYYATEILTETLFTFLLACIAFTCAKIIESRGNMHTSWYLVLGVLCGLESLVRTQFIFFLPLALFVWAILLRKTVLPQMKNTLLSFVVFLAVVSSWGLIVYSQTGSFSLTEGRQERALHERAVRAKLSYSELTRYAKAWLERSIRGGIYDPFLDLYDFRHIDKQYALIATSPEAIEQIKQEDLETLKQRPGHYLYGNLIEVMKVLYIEHDYTDSQSRYFRPVLYAILYTFAFFGLIQLLRKKVHQGLHNIGYLALFFIAYNCAVLSFFDAIPRYNTPYLLFFILIGFIGTALLRRHRSQ